MVKTIKIGSIDHIGENKYIPEDRYRITFEKRGHENFDEIKKKFKENEKFHEPFKQCQHENPKIIFLTWVDLKDGEMIEDKLHSIKTELIKILEG